MVTADLTKPRAFPRSLGDPWAIRPPVPGLLAEMEGLPDGASMTLRAMRKKRLCWAQLPFPFPEGIPFPGAVGTFLHGQLPESMRHDTSFNNLKVLSYKISKTHHFISYNDKLEDLDQSDEISADDVDGERGDFSEGDFEEADLGDPDREYWYLYNLLYRSGLFGFPLANHFYQGWIDADRQKMLVINLIVRLRMQRLAEKLRGRAANLVVLGVLAILLSLSAEASDTAESEPPPEPPPRAPGVDPFGLFVPRC